MVSSVSVIGLGKLGSPMAACFAARGFPVKAVVLNPQKVDAINRGVAPVHEPGLEELIHESGGRLHASQNIGEAVIGGLSMGGYVAFAIFRHAPRYFQGMILADTRPQADTAEAVANRQ